jgi:hypothetical protein
MQWNDEIKLTDIFMLFAVLTGPFIGIFVQKKIESWDFRRQRREHIFRTLMATRRTQLSFEHVQVLNLIDVDFYGQDKQSQAVLTAWKAYQNHLNNHQLLHNEFSLWVHIKEQKFFDLIEKMAVALNFSIDRTHLESVSYQPQAYATLEDQQREILEKLIGLLNGRINIPVRLIDE